MRKTPVIPGHQVVGTIDQLGQSVSDWAVGDRVGVAWLQHVDGTCRFCRRGDENLCPDSTDLPDANRALADMKHSRIDGSAVLRIG
jgi:D-arabinose 1-dehydrogenase-like Zn-dependent alcohol dehydrogenase